MEFHEILTDLRESRQLTRRSMSKKIGIPHQRIATWERGEGKPSFDYVAKLADFFNVSTDYLFGRSEKRLK